MRFASCCSYGPSWIMFRVHLNRLYILWLLFTAFCGCLLGLVGLQYCTSLLFHYQPSAYLLHALLKIRFWSLQLLLSWLFLCSSLSFCSTCFSALLLGDYMFIIAMSSDELTFYHYKMPLNTVKNIFKFKVYFVWVEYSAPSVLWFLCAWYTSIHPFTSSLFVCESDMCFL